MKKFQDPSRTGDWAELKAVIWLWEQGYEVFRNCGCTGAIDLVAIKDGETVKINVKTLTRIKEGSYVFRTQGMDGILAKGIRILWVSKEGTVGWNRDYF